MKKLFKIFMVLGLSIGLGFSLGACKKDQGSDDEDGGGHEVGKGEIIDFSEIYSQKTTIKVWLDDQKGKYAEELIEAFNKTEAGKNIHVQFTHAGSVESRDRLKTYGPLGLGPDVFQFPHDHLSPAIVEDLVYALPESTQELVEERSLQVAADIASAVYDEETGEYGGEGGTPKLYAVPSQIESVMLYYNKNLVDEVPATFEEILAKGAEWNAVVEEGTTQTRAQRGHYYLTTSSHWADSYFMQMFYSAFGYIPFGKEQDKNNVGFDSQELKDALTFINTSLKDVVMSGTEPDGQGANFVAGHIPYIIAGPWNNEEYLEAEALKDNLGVSVVPNINGKPSQTFAGSIMTAIYKYSKNRDAAVAFVEFMLSDEGMEIMYKHKKKLPALKTDLLDNIAGVTDNEALMVMSEQLQNSVPMPTLPEVQYYWGPGESMLKALYKGQGIADITSEAQDGYESKLDLGQ